jgi:hypothetical protein
VAMETTDRVERVEAGAGMKRKRDDEEEDAKAEDHDRSALGSPAAKRWREQNAPGEVDGVEGPKESRPQLPDLKDPKTLRRVREVVESQFNLEILLKHNELRLINQELAKAQVALEQLRRCHLVPFPISQGDPAARLNIANGTGPALAQGDVRPKWAPPYGVVDGPYTRHYAKWLIPDPAFDGIAEWERPAELARAGKTVEGRTTRNSYADTPTTKSRMQRGNPTQKLQALPSGYTQSKENAGPSIIKRSDGQYVKLVCLDCRRENFGSTQGFINHCRIAHRREFKSHEEAASQSGQPIEVDEVGQIVGEDKTPTSASGLVHPLIRTAPTDRSVIAKLLECISESTRMYHEGKMPGLSCIPGTVPTPNPLAPVSASRENKNQNANFVPSSQTPHLSNLLRSRGFDRNLGDMIVDAKTKTVIPEDDPAQDAEESDADAAADANKDTVNDGKSKSKSKKDKEKRAVMQPRFGGLDGSADTPPARVPSRSAISPAPPDRRPNSSKGPENGSGARNPAPAILPPSRVPAPFSTPISTNASLLGSNRQAPAPRLISHALTLSHGGIDADNDNDADADVPMLDGPCPSIIDLSPNTVASNNAPSLVSDDGEYDDGDDAESEMEGEDSGDESSVAEISFEELDAATAVHRERMVGKVERVKVKVKEMGMKIKDGKGHVGFVREMRRGG